jgi:hypothetical protein
VEHIGKLVADQVQPVKYAYRIESAGCSIETGGYGRLDLFPINGS